MRKSLAPFLVLLWCLCGGSVRAQTVTRFGAPPPENTVPPGPTWEDYQAVLRRLDAAEQQLQNLGPVESPPYQGFSVDSQNSVFASQPPASGGGSAAPKPAAPAALATPPKTFPNVRLSGFFHLDSAIFSQDAANQALLGDIQNGVGFRRARLQALGSVTDTVNYSLEMDFAIAGRPSFMDVWAEQTKVPLFGNIRVGQFRQPGSLDAITSIKQLEFLERSLPFQAFVPFRRLGIMAYDHTDTGMLTWQYGVFKTGAFLNQPLGDTRFGTDIGDNGGYSAAGRLTALLLDSGGDGVESLHVGGSYNYCRNTGGTATGDVYEARVIPEFFVGDPAGGGLTSAGTPFFADTGRLASHQFHFFGVEAAGQYGPVHFQAEYMATSVDQIGGPTVFYDGAYAQAGWFLTGEHRVYNRTFGAYDKITPASNFLSTRGDGSRGLGAWELVGRWSYVNLIDAGAIPIVAAAGPPPTPNAGRLQDVTCGVNWYLNPFTKCQLHWTHCYLDNLLTGNSDCDFVSGRLQLEF